MNYAMPVKIGARSFRVALVAGHSTVHEKAQQTPDETARIIYLGTD
jgi:hypothetical protein